MDVKKKKKQKTEVATSFLLMNDAAFDRMCRVMKLSEKESEFAALVIAGYEISKKRIGDPASYPHTSGVYNLMMSGGEYGSQKGWGAEPSVHE